VPDDVGLEKVWSEIKDELERGKIWIK